MSDAADAFAWPGGEAYAALMQRWSEALREAAGPEGFAATSEKFMAAFVEQQAVRAQMVEQWAGMMQELAGTDAFAAASGQLLALYAQQVQALRSASRATAETLQIATTEDLAAASQLVLNVERKVEEAGAQLDAIADRLDAIERRFDAVEAAVRAIGERPAAPERAAADEAPAAEETPAVKRTAARRTAAKRPAAKRTSRSTPPADKG